MLRKTATFLLPALALATMSIVSFGQGTPTNVTFSKQTYTTGPLPQGLVSGDFNNDGKPDLAVIDQDANHVSILLGTGGGLFTPGSDIATGNQPVQIVTGTFTLTGKQDLAIANVDKTITVLLGHGDGTFLAETIALQGVPAALVAADLLNDGLTQLVDVECTQTNAGSCSLNVYQSDAHALFQRSQTIPLPGAPIDFGLIASEDFNIDGKPDVAVATLTQVLVFQDVSSFNGTGAAQLKLLTTITPPNTTIIVGLAAGHFNAGASPDLAIESFDNLNGTGFPDTDRVYLNTGTSPFSFFLKGTVPGTRSFGHHLNAADVNGDGIQDLVMAGTGVRSASVQYALGRGDGTFTTPVTIAGSDSSSQLIVRDFSLDSRQDLAFTDNNLLAGTEAADVLLNQNATVNCAPPGSGTLAVQICAATTASKSLSVKAAGNSPNGVKRVELWVDGNKLTQAFSDQLNAKVGVASGSHSVTVVGIDLYDAIVKKTITVTVP
jgi:hypothetical protein